MEKYQVRDLSLAPSGHRKIQWVRDNMPLLRGLEDEFIKTKPFEGIKISLSVHLEAKTAYLCLGRRRRYVSHRQQCAEHSG